MTVLRAAARAAIPLASTPNAWIAPDEISYEVFDFERLPIARLLERYDPELHAACVAEQKHQRAYCIQHLYGRVEQWDQRAGEDHGFLPWEAIDGALKYGLLSSGIPPIFGGRGVPAIAGAFGTEEISAADAGMSVVFGAHSLALATLLAMGEPKDLIRFRDIALAERKGDTILYALAYTEPGGGSDVEDRDEIKKGRIASKFEKVPGGYRVNARKMFVSNGGIARFNVFVAYSDPTRPHETCRAFIVPNDHPGFSVGRVERKMGQRLSPAAEVMLDDAFIPEEDSVAPPDPARAVDTILSMTRSPVGAQGTGIARGALQRTLRYLSQKRKGGHWLFEEQWVQMALADMMARIQAGRGLFIEGALALDYFGLGLTAGKEPPLPQWAKDRGVLDGLIRSPKSAVSARENYERLVPPRTLDRVVAHGSVSKFYGTDMAVEVCMLAQEILGEDASDPTWGVEKCLRDAKLTQIFEGTNQVCRLHVTRGFLTARGRKS